MNVAESSTMLVWGAATAYAIALVCFTMLLARHADTGVREPAAVGAVRAPSVEGATSATSTTSGPDVPARRPVAEGIARSTLFAGLALHLGAVVTRCARLEIDEYVLDPAVGRWVPERTNEDDWELCRNFEAFLTFGRPVLAAISRKTFIGDLLGKEPEERLAGTLALTMDLVRQGAAVVRSHDVAETADLLRVYEKMRQT